MLSQAGTGFSFNTKRSRLREKLTLLHYDPVVFCYNPFFSSDSEKKSPLCGTEKNTLPLNNGLKMNLIYK
ncbi:hypothetical protein E2I00_016659 [Balaenoptera physalus]|uniref:39S ribosomal protein L33, mitochondrial n=1 Tax=Balaenoptera physalus TaxID=9770 RepID=A0A643CCK6_BALPH|nr:hypothetical protein E2I00_016659 [Balaenoptera physalus]